MENYLYSLDVNFLYEFCRFRTLKHKLPIESGRWQNVDRKMRICNLCDKKEMETNFIIFWNVIILIILGKNILTIITEKHQI
jgi:hypothetical protein